jgi:hypothetical protein
MKTIFRTLDVTLISESSLTIPLSQTRARYLLHCAFNNPQPALERLEKSIKLYPSLSEPAVRT